MLKRLRNSNGSSILEAAIVTPLLLLLTFAIVDFGAMFYVYLAIENGVSQATRYGVTNALMDDPTHPGSKLSRVESIKLAMRQATPTLTIDDADFTFASRPVSGGWWTNGPAGPNEIQKVTVAHTWSFITPLMWPFFTNGEIRLSVDSVMKNEALVQ